MYVSTDKKQRSFGPKNGQEVVYSFYFRAAENSVTFFPEAFIHNKCIANVQNYAVQFLYIHYM